jgi:hypothetical protein
MMSHIRFKRVLGYIRRFAEILGAVCLATAGETIKLRLTGYPGNFIMYSVAAQHTEMGMFIAAASARSLVFHSTLPPIISVVSQ